MFFSLVIVVIVFAIIIKLIAIYSCGKCNSKTCLIGKTVIITGSDRGIGFETALDLASRGAKIILTSNNEKGVLEARDKIILLTGNKNIIAKHVDYLSLSEIRKFAKYILENENRLDILINNVGTGSYGKKKTEDGLLCSLQINYFGHFLLTNLLLGLLKKSAPSRIINTSSVASYFPWLNENNINTTTEIMSNVFNYSNSKYMLAAMTFEMADRLKDNGVTVNCLHPGIVKTDILKTGGNLFYAITRFVYFYLKNVSEGAQTTIKLAVSQKFAKISGKFCLDCRPFHLLVPLSKNRQQKIWEQSIKLVNLRPYEMHC